MHKSFESLLLDLFGFQGILHCIFVVPCYHWDCVWILNTICNFRDSTLVYAYLRISTDKQDNDKQEFLVLEYAQKNKIIIDEILRVEMSSRKSEEARRITELKAKLNKDDVLITAELSRLGRAMLEVMKLVLELDEKGVKLIFIRQPELSTFDSAHKKFILAVYAYFVNLNESFYPYARSKA